MQPSLQVGIIANKAYVYSWVLCAMYDAGWVATCWHFSVGGDAWTQALLHAMWQAWHVIVNASGVLLLWFCDCLH